MKAGYNRKAKPGVNVLRNYSPNSTNQLDRNAPPKDGEGIKDGMVGSLAWNSSTDRYEFIKGATADKTIYIFKRNQDDTDVESAGLISAYSTADNFEVETAYYTGNAAFKVDDKLTYDGVTGNIKLAGEGDLVIGFVSGTEDSPIDTSGTNSGVVNGNVIRWTTALNLPQIPVSAG